VLFFAPSMGGGGAERVLSLLVTALSAQDFDIHLALAQKQGSLVNTLPPSVVVHDLKSPRVSRAAVSLVRVVRRVRPTTVMSTITHANLLAALVRPAFPTGCRLVVRETNCLDWGFSRSMRMRVVRPVYPRIMRQADAIVCQTETMRRELAGAKLPEQKLVTIRNPVDFEGIERQSQAPCDARLRDDETNVVAISRFDPMKGVDRLLDAAPSLFKSRPNARLWLLGEGPMESELRNKARSLGIDDRVAFVGFQANPWAWMRRASLFVLPSRFDPSSNSLLESIAMNCRLPFSTPVVPKRS